MIIEGTDFRLTNDGMSSHFDLEVMRTVRPRGKPEREEWSDPLYGMPLERAIKIIINYRLESYKDQLNLLKETLKNYGIEEETDTND